MSDQAVTAVPEAPKLLREGAFLAASSAVAYYIAFSFETGYADCYGFPHWAVDVSTLGIIIAWGSIAGGLLTALMLYFLVGLLIPARAVRILIFNRPAFLLCGAATICLTASFTGDHAPWWLFEVGFGICATLVALVVLWWGGCFRGTDAALSFLERVERDCQKVCVRAIS